MSVLAQASVSGADDHWQWYATILVGFFGLLGVVFTSLTSSQNGRKIEALTTRNGDEHEGNRQLLLSMAKTLAETHSTLSLIAATNDKGYFKTTPEGLCVDVNAAYERITGLSFEQALGNGWATALHPEDRPKVTSAWLRAIHEKTKFGPMTYRFVSNDVVHECEVTSIPIRSGEVVEGWVGIVAISATSRLAKEYSLARSDHQEPA